MPAAKPECKFCQIVSKELPSCIVFEDEISLGFLDHRPLFAGHVLFVPKEHFETLADLPVGLVGLFFADVQRLTAGVERAMKAEGSFVAINNRVSQSVPHLHVHIVPRRKKDGLRGFFWPRQAHPDQAEMRRAQAAIRSALDRDHQGHADK